MVPEPEGQTGVGGEIRIHARPLPRTGPEARFKARLVFEYEDKGYFRDSRQLFAWVRLDYVQKTHTTQSSMPDVRDEVPLARAAGSTWSAELEVEQWQAGGVIACLLEGLTFAIHDEKGRWDSDFGKNYKVQLDPYALISNA